MISNLVWLSICIYFEARGEVEEGKIAVAHVIMNRAERRELSVEEVVKQPYQFSWYNDGERPHIKNYEAFIECTQAAFKCLDERLSGETLRGIDHYHASWMSVYPFWSHEYTVVARIGKHIFYKS